MGSPPGQKDTADGRLAPPAGLPGAQVNAVLELEEAAHPVGIDIIGHRRSAQADRVRENLAQRDAQPFKLRAREPARSPPRPDSRMKQALVRIDVADSGKKRLVEQSGLDGQLAAPEQCRKLLRAHRERVRARRAKRLSTLKIAELQPAETPRIDKPKLSPAGQAQAGMRMRSQRCLRRGHQKPAAHAKMNDPLGFGPLVRTWSRLAVRRSQLADDVFSGAMNGQNAAPGKPLGLPRWRGFEWLGMPAEPGVHNPVAAHPFVDAAGNGFHLGQFRHSFLFYKDHL
jgi:hypothetical protein